MLAITENAAEAIRNLTSDPALPETCGVRIATDEQSSGLALSLAEQPGDDDVVVDGQGAPVFLTPAASEVLTDQVLDVTAVPTDDQHELRFTVAPQAAGERPS